MEQPVVQGVEQAGAVQPEVRTSDYDAIIKGIIAAGGKNYRVFELRTRTLLKRITILWFPLLSQTKFAVMFETKKLVFTKRV